MKNKNLVIGCIVSAAVAGGAGFYGGTIYQKAKVANLRGGYFGQMQNGGTRNAGTRNSANGSANTNQGIQFRGGMVEGEVSAIDDKSITVKMNDGSSKIIVLSGSTTYRMSQESSLDKISVGTKVAVAGTANSDGSTTANSIEINPILREIRTGAPSNK